MLYFLCTQDLASNHAIQTENVICILMNMGETFIFFWYSKQITVGDHYIAFMLYFCGMIYLKRCHSFLQRDKETFHLRKKKYFISTNATITDICFVRQVTHVVLRGKRKVGLWRVYVIFHWTKYSKVTYFFCLCRI